MVTGIKWILNEQYAFLLLSCIHCIARNLGSVLSCANLSFKVPNLGLPAEQTN